MGLCGYQTAAVRVWFTAFSPAGAHNTPPEAFMTAEDIAVRFDYGYWVNAKLFPVISQLTPEEFTRSITGGWASIRTTLVHVMSAEWGWISRCGGRPDRGPKLDPTAFETPTAVIDLGRTVEGYGRTFFASLTDADLLRPIDYSFEPGTQRFLPVGALLQHAATHGVHHRGQIAAMLRVLGRPAGNFDMLFYFAERANAGAGLAG